MASGAAVTIGLVGCGGISHYHMAGIQAANAAAKSRAAAGGARAASDSSASASDPELRVVACADIVEATARGWAEKYGVERWFTDWRAMVEAARPDIVLFATWPSQHREQVAAAAEMGVPAILCEKSLALTAADGHAMADACRRSGTLLMEAFMYRHAPRTRDFVRRIREGEIGEPRWARAAFGGWFYDPKGTGWRSRKDTGGGIVFDFTCYCVNILRAVMGRSPKRVAAAVEVCPVQDVIITLHGLLDYGEGVTAVVESSQKEYFRMEAEVVGAQGSLLLPAFLMNVNPQPAPPMRLTTGLLWAGNWKETPIPTTFENPYALQIRNLARALRHGEPLGMPQDETLENLATLDALVESSKAGNWSQLGTALP